MHKFRLSTDQEGASRVSIYILYKFRHLSEPQLPRR